MLAQIWRVMKKKVIAVLVLSLILIFALIGCDAKLEKIQLAMGSDTKLKTLILTDIKFDGTSADDVRERIITSLVNQREPEFIAINGNIVNAENNGEVMKKAVKFIDSFGIPWATSIGELDVKGNTPKKKIVKILTDKSLKNSMVLHGESYEYNYILEVVDTKSSIKHLFYFIDTSERCSDELVEWYTNTIKNISFKNVDKKGNMLKSEVFINKPLPVYTENTDAIGSNGYEVSVWENSAIFENAILNSNSTKAVYAGTDNLANGAYHRKKEILFAYVISMAFDSSMKGTDYNMQKRKVGGSYYDFTDSSSLDSLSSIRKLPDDFKESVS